MVPLLDLWLPIVLSAVFVFVVSSVIHMALPIHKKDMKRLPDEDKVLSAMRSAGVAAGQYMFPSCSSMKEMGSPEMLAKMKQGPVGNMIVLPSQPFSMGKSLGQWFALSLVISACAAYVAGLTLAPGADGMLVFRVTSAAALLGYALSHVSDSIWKGLAWSVSLKFFGDGIAYALATGAAFAWLWPAAGA
jgi:hypothetical protein